MPEDTYAPEASSGYARSALLFFVGCVEDIANELSYDDTDEAMAEYAMVIAEDWGYYDAIA